MSVASAKLVYPSAGKEATMEALRFLLGQS